MSPGFWSFGLLTCTGEPAAGQRLVRLQTSLGAVLAWEIRTDPKVRFTECCGEIIHLAGLSLHW